MADGTDADLGQVRRRQAGQDRGLASSVVVEIRDGRRRAAATATSLAAARRRYAGEAVIGVLG